MHLVLTTRFYLPSEIVQIFSEISTRIRGPESSVHFNKGGLTSSELTYGFYRTMFLNALHSGSETTYNELKIVFSK